MKYPTSRPEMIEQLAFLNNTGQISEGERAMAEKAMDGLSMYDYYGWLVYQDEETERFKWEIYDLDKLLIVEAGHHERYEKARSQAAARAELHAEKRRQRDPRYL